jgi:hypothetical protein
VPHRIDGFDLKFTNRNSWKAYRNSIDGKLIDTIPVTWRRDYERKANGNFLTVWFRDAADRRTYRTRQEPFVVALAQEKDKTAEPLEFKHFAALFLVRATGKLRGRKHGIEVRVLKRVRAD